MEFGDARQIEFAGRSMLVVRITYVGELGWELHLPAEGMLDVYDAIKAAGARDAGHHAIRAMRLEKGYRAFGHELSPDETPLEAGLGFALAWQKEFLGKTALRSAPRRKRLLSLVLEDPGVMLWGGEPILLDGEIVGYTTSATFSPTLGAAVALGYVRGYVKSGSYVISNAGVACAAQASLCAPFDPQRERILK
jgi:4-methylaminobutanoate oxidase (formaldehyde-forming)